MKWDEPGKKKSFGEGLYTLWPRTDHVVMFVHKKNKSGAILGPILVDVE
jgi:hypothetical protein